MEIFKILNMNKFIYAIILFIMFSCYNVSKQHILNVYTNVKYTISKCDDSIEPTELISDISVPANGESLYKGKKISPFGDIYNDDSGIFITKTPKKKLEIYLFTREKQYVGKIFIKDTKERKVVKVEKTDLQKIFKPDMYIIYILEEKVPLLKYKLFLLY